MLTNFDKIKIADKLMLIFEAIIKAAFVETNYAFSKSGHGDAEVGHKRHDSAEEKPHRKKLNLILLIEG